MADLSALTEPEDDKTWKALAGQLLIDMHTDVKEVKTRMRVTERFMWAIGGGLVILVILVVPLLIESVRIQSVPLIS